MIRDDLVALARLVPRAAVRPASDPVRTEGDAAAAVYPLDGAPIVECDDVSLEAVRLGEGDEVVRCLWDRVAVVRLEGWAPEVGDDRVLNDLVPLLLARPLDRLDGSERARSLSVDGDRLRELEAEGARGEALAAEGVATHGSGSEPRIAASKVRRSARSDEVLSSAR